MTAKGKEQTARAALGSSSKDPFDGYYTFRKLVMWQRAQELADRVLSIVAVLPADRPSAILGQQIVRSATSIAANIAEGHARYSPGAYRNHLSIARGSTAETISWIDLLVRRRLIGDDEATELLGLCAELMKMLTAKMIELERQTGTTRVLRDEIDEYII
jgi:four helix bundle protein